MEQILILVGVSTLQTLLMVFFSTLFAADHASGNIKNRTSLDVIITLKTVNFIIY